MPFDPSPFLNAGAKGVLLFLTIGAVLIIGWLIKQLLAKPTPTPSITVREPSAGEKDATFWQKDYDTRAAAQTKIFVEHLGKLRARLRQIEDKIDKNASEAKHDMEQVRRDIATLARSIEMSSRE